MNEKFLKLMKKVYKKSDIYKNKMKCNNVSLSDIKSINDIYKLPFLDKEDLVNNYPYGIFMEKMDKIMELHSSSGTTSKPVVVGFTKKDLKSWADANEEICKFNGFKKDDIVQMSIGYGMFTGAMGFHRGLHKIGATIVPIGTGNTKKQIEFLKDFNVTAIETTPNFAIYMAEAAEKMKVHLKDLNIRLVSVGSEQLTESLRQRIKELYGNDTIVVQNYGLCELRGPAVAGECKYLNGMHITSNIYPEIIDPITKKQLPLGSIGELTLTLLDSDAMPIIRYNTHDITSLKYTKCKCGYCGLSIDKIIGRTDSMLKIKGVCIFPSQIEDILLKTKDITSNYEVIIENINYKDKVTINIEYKDKILIEDEIKKIKKEIINNIKEYIGIKVDVNILAFNTLKRFDGKVKRIMDLRK